MSPNFVRYSAGVERVDPDFERNLEQVVRRMQDYIRASVRTDPSKRAVRDAHATGYGLARGSVEILDGVPGPYAQGIYAQPGHHDALVRFSNGVAHTGPDASLGSVCGIGLKIFDIDGPKLVEDESDCSTFDYAMINHPVFFANSVEHYVTFQQLVLGGSSGPVAEQTPEEARLQYHRFLHDWLTCKGTLPPDEWAWEELFALLELRQIQPINLLLSTYWTMAALRHGDFIAKVRVKPVTEFAAQVVLRDLDLESAPEVFRPALVAELKAHPYEFEIQVQLCADLARMPVEETTTLWPESLSPFVTVAKLRLAQQEIDEPGSFERMDAISISPWRCTEAHRPLGSIMRARREVYRKSSILRHALNQQKRREPKSLAEVFGPSEELCAVPAQI